MSSVSGLPNSTSQASTERPLPAASTASGKLFTFPYLEAAKSGKPSFIPFSTNSTVKGCQGITRETVEMMASGKRTLPLPFIENPVFKSAVVSSEESEEAPSQSEHPLKTPVQGIAKGGASTVAAAPFNARLAQVAILEPGKDKPRMGAAFNNIGSASAVAMVGRMAGGVIFMSAYSATSELAKEMTDSPVAQAVLPPVVGAITETSVKTPAENITLRLQLDSRKTTPQCAKEIFAAKGVRGFYQGNVPQLSAAMLGSAIIFPGSKIVNAYLTGGENSDAPGAIKLASNFFSGVVVGTIATPVTHPIYRTMIVQRNDMSSFTEAAKKIIQQGAGKPEGAFRGVLSEAYKGFVVALCRKPIVAGATIGGIEAVRLAFEKMDQRAE